MLELQKHLSQLLMGIEFISALVGFIYFFKLKRSYWKWFSVYLVVIFIQEYFWYGNNTSYFGITKNEYYAFFGIPIQYLFFYWLYALKSLKNKWLFLFCTTLYLVTLPIAPYFEKLNIVYSINLNVAILLIILLLALEFIKQIKNDNILYFKENKMFYLNVGMVVFYIGSYPFQAFSEILFKQHFPIWDVYYTYFLVANCIMYLSFSASFIWGKQES